MLSVIYINFLIFFKKYFNKNLKIIFIYFPIRSDKNFIYDLIEKIKKEKNIEVILGYNTDASEELKIYKKTFFFNLSVLKYIKKIDIFISSYVVYEFPDCLNKIYINHDIYDTPMVNHEKESFLFNSLCKYNYIFVPSDVSKKLIENKINDYVSNELKKPILINTGYLKLDYISEQLKQTTDQEDSVLLAPTLSSMLIEYNLNDHLDTIIGELLKNTKNKIIYRPHPGDVRDKIQNIKIKKIIQKYKNNNHFTIDLNTSYLESYKKSKILITDFSGTAYTFAFSTLKPVIFFSINDNKLKTSTYKNLFFFKDRNEIGKVIENMKYLNDTIESLISKINIYSHKIKLLRSRRILYFQKSIEQNLICIRKILNLN